MAGSHLIILEDAGCSRCFFVPPPPSLFLRPSLSTFRFINIHRWLIDGYDFLALPSGFSAMQPRADYRPATESGFVNGTIQVGLSSDTLPDQIIV